MTQTPLSRRNLMALAGAGAAATALAGCTAGSNSSGNESIEDDNFGDDPHGTAMGRTGFNPKFMAVVHLTSPSNWGINSNDAHFEFIQPNYDKAARTAWASEILLNKISNKLPRFRDAPRGSRFQVYDRTPTAPKPDYADEVEFARFGFGQPHDIYVFFEHQPGELSFDPSRLLGFSRLLLSGKNANKNKAFDDAEIVTDPAVLGRLVGLGTLIRLNNYCTIEDDKGYHQLPFGDVKSQNYKLNLYYKTRSGIAMAIDPDTGNGVGHEP
jgi:hypothetical protein